jgi:regulator of protease activity HflC (stomatin/prohibitin superfamily)
MIAEVLAILVQIVTYLWPFRIVKEGEIGELYVFGRWRKELGEGCYFIVPFFMSISDVSIAWDPVRTGRIDIRTADDKPLSFSCSARSRVIDARRMLRELDDYKGTAHNIVSSVIAERLGQVKAERLLADGRGRLFFDLRRWVQEEATPFGIEIADVRFTSLVLDTPYLRLLMEDKSP